MSGIFLYAHGGSGNHGCEAIVRATAAMLPRQTGDITLLSSRADEDRAYGVNQVCTVVPEQHTYSKRSFAFWNAYAALRFQKDYIPMDKLAYRQSFRLLHKGDLALSIGGDNYCYADVERYTMLHSMVRARGAKTVLWGCSVEPEVAANASIARDLSRYDLITARETISYQALKQINPNTVLVSDPAFLLKPVDGGGIPRDFLDGQTIGINVSPMVIDHEAQSGMVLENYAHLIAYILEHTAHRIALIPHVVWENGDDREPLRTLYQRFQSTNRVAMVEDMGCQQLKWVISQCAFFVGARTHATIAAYSTCVPTLVVGYSVKARGIARDIFGEEDDYLLPVQQMQTKDALTGAFRRLYARKEEIRSCLEEVMPSYCARANLGAQALQELVR